MLVEHGVAVLVANTDDDRETEALAFACLRTRRVDAFCFATAVRDDRFLRGIRDAGVRGVLVGQTTAQPLFPAVLADDALGARHAFGYLHRLGHRSVAHLAGPSTTSTGHARARGFEAAARRAGADPRRCPVVTGERFDVDSGRRAVRRALDLLPDLTGDRGRPGDVVLPVHLTVRASTARPAAHRL